MVMRVEESIASRVRYLPVLSFQINFQYYLIPTISIIYLFFLYYFYISLLSSSRSFLYRII